MSRGAWPYFMTLGLDYRGDPEGRGAYGIYAFKRELIYNNFTLGINPSLPYWGKSVVERTKDAQNAFGLNADGVLGPVTARYLFRKRAGSVETSYHLPAYLLARIKTLESGNDPIAQGFVDPDDEGLLQENLPSNPSLTKIECWTPSYIIPYGAQQLSGRIQNCAGSVKAGTAAWNVGNFYANQWRLNGFPPDGGDNNVYARATNYVMLVNNQPL